MFNLHRNPNPNPNPGPNPNPKSTCHLSPNPNPLGMYLTDIMFTEEGNPDKKGGTPRTLSRLALAL